MHHTHSERKKKKKLSIDAASCPRTNRSCTTSQVNIFFIYTEFYVFFRASLHNLFQMKPTRCTLLLSTLISTSLHVPGNYVPIIRRTYYIYAMLVFFTLWCAPGWLYLKKICFFTLHITKNTLRVPDKDRPFNAVSVNKRC